MSASLRQKLGACVWDIPRYALRFVSQIIFGKPAWIKIRDRNQTLLSDDHTPGVSCQWQWTSNLNLPKIFPWWGRKLLKHALKSYPIQLAEKHYNATTSPQVSFIIGHRGMERLPLLLKTLASISAQQECLCECIIVEQDTKPRIEKYLPDWVRYQFIQTDEADAPYSRSWAFNVGARSAKTETLIFHDNDLLIPRCYARDTQSLLKQGHDFINLKRFIFYLTKQATQCVLNGAALTSELHLDWVMQNAEGGGSVGASKAAFFEIGGFDERFVGWGGEDNEFWERAKTKTIWPYTYLPLIHLWHPNQPGKGNNENTSTNNLYLNLSKVPAKERILELRRIDTHLS